MMRVYRLFRGNLFTRATLALIITGLTAVPVMAQNAPAAQPDARPAPPPPPPQTMDLVMARKMAAVAEAAAAAMGAHVVVCVMDSNGDIVLAERMDGGTRTPVSAGIGKARAVLLFGVSTGQIADAVRDKKPLPILPKALPAGAGDLLLLRGGLPVMKDGKLIGVIGVGGSTSENDEKFAQAGIDALTAK